MNSVRTTNVHISGLDALQPANTLRPMHAPGKAPPKRSRSPSVLPEVLVGRESLDGLRAQLKEQKIPTKANEPEWAGLRTSLSKQHGLEARHADEMVRALERLWLLPFHRYDTCAPVLLFLFTQLPGIEKAFRKEKDDDGLTLVAAFRVLSVIMLQGITLFPAEPHHVGLRLMAALSSPVHETRRAALPLARLLASARDGQCGFNRYLAKEPDGIALYEHTARHGGFENVVGSLHKFTNFSRKVAASSLFQREWQALKAEFKELHFWDAGGIVRRSPLPEGNWHRDESVPHFKSVANRFQSAFDVFCWKWFLYGIQRAAPRDKPLVQKLTYSCGPFGTTIFIPGYWSFDASRDLDWKKISGLHKARGVERQGEKLDANHKQLIQQARRAQEADREAKRLALRGDARYGFIKMRSGLDARTDNAQVRRLLQVKSSDANHL